MCGPIFRFTNCGQSLLVGDAVGTTFICALDNMPFPPHFQKDELQATIYKSLTMKPELQHQVKTLLANDQ